MSSRMAPLSFSRTLSGLWVITFPPFPILRHRRTQSIHQPGLRTRFTHGSAEAECVSSTYPAGVHIMPFFTSCVLVQHIRQVFISCCFFTSCVLVQHIRQVFISCRLFYFMCVSSTYPAGVSYHAVFFLHVF